jgi:hypothetical protein
MIVPTSLHSAVTLSPLTSATCAPSGENDGVIAYVTLDVSVGAAIALPVLVSTNLVGKPALE